MLNPFIGILRNTKTGTFHPIIFREAPLPGSLDDCAGVESILGRFKSAAHHTDGFPTREAAMQDIRDKLSGHVAQQAIGPVRYMLNPDQDIIWDGETKPVISAMFMRADMTDKIPA